MKYKVCASCGGDIKEGMGVYHQRLNVNVHGTDDCMKDVYGEDIRMHTITPFSP